LPGGVTAETPSLRWGPDSQQFPMNLKSVGRESEAHPAFHIWRGSI
jgi:hypothetical protein